MAELKTKVNDASVAKFLDAIPDPEKRKDAKAVAKIMQAATKSKPKMWGTSIVGFGTYRYKGASGRSGDWFPLGFSPRKQALTIYVVEGFKRHEKLLTKLGKHKRSAGGCLYINRLADVHLPTLTKIVNATAKLKGVPE
jgi:hypothetical protein